MRRFLILITVLMFQINMFGQKIDYSIPKGYETDINKSDYKTLVDISIEVIKKKYKIDFVKDGAVQLIANQEMQTLNLHNLIVKCAESMDKKRWKQVIEDHFESMFSTIDEQKKINPNDFATIKKYLSIRIYREDFIVQRGGKEKVVAKVDIEGTFTVLMLDLPKTFMAVDRQIFELWKKSEAEVFSIAQSNINEQKIDKVNKKFEVEGGEISVYFLGNEDYAASYALDLARNSPEIMGEWGSVIAVPNKGLVNACAVSKEKPVDFVKFIQFLKKPVEKFYAQHQQPISNHFFWYYGGKFTRIKVVEDDKGNINVIAPMGLSALMATEKKK
jgi:adenine/guanine phosphoribosyltransferase-like PRPP-binding protein